jgi:hypothetical protein
MTVWLMGFNRLKSNGTVFSADKLYVNDSRLTDWLIDWFTDWLIDPSRNGDESESIGTVADKERCVCVRARARACVCVCV